MPVFDSATLRRFYYEGEQVISHEYPFLVDRLSLAIVSGTSLYTIPDYIVSIKRVTYKGQKLDPLPKRNFNKVFQSGTQQGKPFWYIFNNVGQNKIKLFPCPSENVAQGVTNLWGHTDIGNSFIVEYYRISDNATYIIPTYLRRQLLKQYVAMKCFAVEGASQHIKMRDYFSTKWENRKNEFSSLLDELHDKPRKLMVTDIVGSDYFPASPMLPIDRYGISVDQGY